MTEINDKFNDLKSEYLNTLNKIEDIPISSINDISKIIYDDIMKLGNKTLQTWINSKTKSENGSKKNL